jgi:cyclophilin family peptidyl-prolyl cis-trans isomerase
MKTNIAKITRSQKSLLLFIYLSAFVLMTWSLSANAESKEAPAKVTIQSPEVLITTSMGKIKVKLNAERAPITVENFIKYVDKKHYNGTIFHRVIEGFMIQGGGYLPNMKEKDTLAPIKNEAKGGLSNLRGTIAMARTNEIDSATAQFFINVVDNQRLDYKNDNQYGYAVFGEVVEGMDVVDKIRLVKTGSKDGHDDVPVKNVLIKSITKVKSKK